jgi:hypothetical protein
VSSGKDDIFLSLIEKRNLQENCGKSVYFKIRAKCSGTDSLNGFDDEQFV